MFFFSDAHRVILLAAVLPCSKQYIHPLRRGKVYLSVADCELLKEMAENCRGVFNQAVPQDLLSNSAYCKRERKQGQNHLAWKSLELVHLDANIPNLLPKLSCFVLKRTVPL